MSEKATLALTGHDSESPEPAAKKARCSKDCEDSAWRLPESRGLSGSLRPACSHPWRSTSSLIGSSTSKGADPMGIRWGPVMSAFQKFPPIIRPDLGRGE